MSLQSTEFSRILAQNYIWFTVVSSSSFLWTPLLTFGFHIRWWISWPAGSCRLTKRSLLHWVVSNDAASDSFRSTGPLQLPNELLGLTQSTVRWVAGTIYRNWCDHSTPSTADIKLARSVISMGYVYHVKPHKNICIFSLRTWGPEQTTVYSAEWQLARKIIIK